MMGDKAKLLNKIERRAHAVRKAWNEWLRDDGNKFPPPYFLDAVSDLLDVADPDGPEIGADL